MEAVAQFERIVNDSGFVSLKRLTEEDIIGTDESRDYWNNTSRYREKPEHQCRTSHSERRSPYRKQKVEPAYLSDTDDLPGTVSADTRFEKLSTDRSDCRLSFAAPVGLLLSCNHIYNQYLFLDNSEDNLQKFEKSARNMHSLARYSRANQINKEWIEKYLNEATASGCLPSVRTSTLWRGRKTLRN
jgi:hypothetical protein